jgi:hypothetical protein
MEAPASAHLSLKAQCEARRAELQEVTGNLDQIPPIVAGQLSKWIASSKYLGAKETRDVAAATAATAEAKVAAGAQFDSPDAD